MDLAKNKNKRFDKQYVQKVALTVRNWFWNWSPQKNNQNNAVYLNTDELVCSLTERLLPPALCRTLGRCCTFSWVRGDTGECWRLYGWEEGLIPLLLLLLLAKLCSVPERHKQIHLIQILFIPQNEFSYI